MEFYESLWSPLTRDADIHATGPMMFGYIGETRETIKETVDFIKEVKLDTRCFFFSTPYPNTPLYDWAKKNNRIKYDEDTYLSMLGNNAEICLVNLTDFSDEELIRLKNEIEAVLTKAMPLSLKIERIIKRMNYIKLRICSLGVKWAIKKIFKKLCNKNGG